MMKELVLGPLFAAFGGVAAAQTISIQSPPSDIGPASPQSEGGSYLYDDGTAETGAQISPSGDLCWIHEFDALGGSDTIVRISTSFGIAGVPGSSPPDGSPVTLCVWEDPDDDGLPDDAVLLTSLTDVIKQGGTGVLVDYDVTPTRVAGKFFVGAFVTANETHLVSPIDVQTTLFGRAWVAAATPDGTFDPANLAGNTVPPTSLSSFGADFPFVLRAEGFEPPATYCTAKPNSLGCTPMIGFSGQPDPGATSGFRVYATNVRSNKPGLLCYSIDGRASVPFQGGVLCLAAPLRRTPMIGSRGNPNGTDCSGIWVIDMNGFANGTYGGKPAAELLLEGTVVNVQWWGRDKGEPAGFASSLTDALEYVVPAAPPSN